MDRSRDEVCFGGADLRRHGHERIELVDLKKLGYALFKDRRSKWTKPGTLLHARIEPILHGSMPRVGEDRAMPQGTGADFGAPLEPTDDLSRGKIARDLLDELRLGQSLVRQAGLPEGVADFRVTVAKPVKGVSHLIGARVPQRLMIVPQRTAKRRARV